MKSPLGRSFLAVCLSLCANSAAYAQLAPNNKDFEDYTQLDRDAAKAAARKAHFSSFRVCADPGNMPFTNIKQEGFDNKIADVIATALGTKATYFWRPFNERGLTRQTFDTNDCDILMDVPLDFDAALTTFPIYKSTYVLASRTDRHYDFKSLQDPRLHQLQIGVYELSALRQSLANNGIVGNVKVHEVSHDGDLDETHQPWWQVKQVADGKLDVAAVWGPFAGWVKAKGAPITLQPTNLMDDIIPMEFELSIGVRKTDAVTKYAIENALNDHVDEIKKILNDYGVPLVECAACLISGPIKAHGIYTKPTVSAEELAKLTSERPEVTLEELKKWLKKGASVDAEFANAVLAADDARIEFLLKKGADIDKKDPQGYTPLTSSVRLGSLQTTKFLLDHGAKVDAPDNDGWSPVFHAVLRNDVPALKALVAKGANIELRSPGGYTALAIAVEEKKFDVAKTLIDSGAKVDVAVGTKKVTPLMVAASERPPDTRNSQVLQTLDSVAIARELIKHGADVNKATAEGVTPLMIAAVRDNAPMIGVLVQAGAKLDERSGEGETAREIAGKNDARSAMRILDLYAKKVKK